MALLPRSSATLRMVDLPLAPLLFAPVERVGVPVGKLTGGRSANIFLLDWRSARLSAGKRSFPSRGATGVTSAEGERLELGSEERLRVAMREAAPSPPHPILLAPRSGALRARGGDGGHYSSLT
jgi:hypothetical protein